MAGRQVELQKSTFSSGNSSMKGLPTPTLGGGGDLPAQYKHLDGISSSIPNYGLSGFSINPALASMIAQHLGTGNLPPLLKMLLQHLPWPPWDGLMSAWRWLAFLSKSNSCFIGILGDGAVQ